MKKIIIIIFIILAILLLTTSKEEIDENHTQSIDIPNKTLIDTPVNTY